MKLLTVFSIVCLSVAWAQSICDVRNSKGQICTCDGSVAVCKCDPNYQDLIVNGVNISLPINLILEVENCQLFQLGPNANGAIGSRSLHVRNVSRLLVTGAKDVTFDDLTVSQVEQFSIRNASQVSVNRLNVTRARHFEIDPTAKLSVTNLTVVDVQEVDLANMAVKDNVEEPQNFAFRNCTLPQLKTNALHGLHLQRLEFVGCNIRSISGNAVSDAFKPQLPSFLILRDCSVGPVESNGFVVDVQFVNIVNNTFNGRLASSSLRVNFRGERNNLTFHDNRFKGHLVNDTFHMSNVRLARFGNNIFEFVHRRSFVNVNADELQMENNTVSSSRGIPFIAKCDKCNIRNNRLPCDCLTLKEMESDLQQLNASRSDTRLAKEILGNPCRHNRLTNPRKLIEGDQNVRAKECALNSAHSPLTSVLTVVLFVFIARLM